MKTIDAHLLYQPLITNFEVVPFGGSNVQKYNGTDGSYVPDRTITPFVLRPHLVIHDPDGQIDDGDKTTDLINCRWTANGISVVTGVDGYTVDTNGQLTISHNVGVDISIFLELTCQYLDPRREEVLTFKSNTTLSCVASQDYSIFLDIDAAQKKLLYVLDNTETTVISCQLRNGIINISDDKAVYAWQVFDGGAWRDISSSVDCWYVSGQATRTLTVTTDRIQNILLRCMAHAIAYPDVIKIQTTRLYRYYGQYEECLDIIKGEYLTNTTPGTEVHCTVRNRQGNITDPCRYFDISILFAPNFVEKRWRKLSSTTEAYITKKDMNVDYSARPTFGVKVREKSAYIPLTIGGDILTAAGAQILIQVPKEYINE